MPSILQLRSIDYTDISDTIFIGGTSATEISSKKFFTRDGQKKIVFTGDNFTYGVDGQLTGGIIEEYRVFFGPSNDLGNQRLIVSSNFDLLSGTELTTAFQTFESGDEDGASQLVLDSWTAEFFSHSNLVGGPLRGYQGGDSLSGSSDSDIVRGFEGDDVISLNGGDDIGFGGEGNDFIFGGEGNDRINGESGNDSLRGDNGDDILRGGSGDDFLRGEVGDDVLLGGGGNDNLSGGRFDDRLLGGGGDDFLDGGRENDELFGGAGNDTLIGGNGDDLLRSSAGFDILEGGNGRDTFILRGGDSEVRGGRDSDTFIIIGASRAEHEILDFANNSDVLDLQSFAFADAAAVQAAATETAGGDVDFDLGNGQHVIVAGINFAALENDIIF